MLFMAHLQEIFLLRAQFFTASFGLVVTAP